MKNKTLLMTIAIMAIAMSSIAQVTGIFTDSRDGKVYKTVTIGTQTWMAENLAYKTKKGCWAYNKDESNVKAYGYLYSWDTAKTACPKGWHLPNYSEWEVLTTYLGGDSAGGILAGGKLKEISSTHWNYPNAGATNESGFTALPGGYRNYHNTFVDIGDFGTWWSSTEEDQGSSFACCWYLRFDYCYVDRSCYGNKVEGLSVRCIKD